MADSAAPNQGAQQPTIHTLAQFVRDLSFENPNAPRSLQPQEGQNPEINITVNVNARQGEEGRFEVDLHLEGSAKVGADVLFAFDLKYGCLLQLANIPAEQVHPAVMIEGPRLVFPFARQIIADAVRNGGFPPLYIDPIDFVGLYRQKMMEAQAAGQGAPLAS